MEKLTINYQLGKGLFPVYNNLGNVKYIDGEVAYLVNEKGERVSNYYPRLTELGISGYYRVLYTIKERKKKPIIRCKVIKVVTDTDGKVIPFQEQWVLEDFYQYIRNGFEETILVAKDGVYSYVDIRNTSPYYGKLLFPLGFTYATAFNLEYPLLASVNLSYKRGYILRPDEPIKKSEEIKLIPKDTIKEIIKDVDFEQENAQVLIRSLIKDNLKK